MKNKLLITCIAALSILNGNAQCVSRPYTPKWDWREQTYTFITGDQNGHPNTITKESPWYDSTKVNLNTKIFFGQETKDYEPADGWVLIQRDFGSTRRPTDNPFFILYNKYSGILRVFVCITKQHTGYNSAVITLKYDTPGIVTANLENHTTNSYRSALDNFDNTVPEINVPNYFSNNTPFWLHADFTMNYDPCTCKNKSGLFFEAKLISTANLTFELNGTAVEKWLDATGKSSDGTQSLAKTGQSIIDAGNSFFKSAESGISTFKRIFPKYVEKHKKDLEKLEKIVPGLSAAVGVVDFLTGLFSSDASAPQPMSFDINLKAKGTLTTGDVYQNVLFQNPGSVNRTIVPYTMLNYNNTMGIFNLLETPSVTISTKSGSHVTDHESYYPVISYKCKLNNPISYIINPEPEFDLNKSEIKFALVFEIPSTSFSGVDLGYEPDYDHNDYHYFYGSSNNLVEEEVKDGKRIIRTQFISTSCSGNISTLFTLFNTRGNAHPDIYLKVIGTFVKDNKTSVYVSKYKVNQISDDSKFRDSSFWPSSLSYLPEDISLLDSNKGVTGNAAWNSISFSSLFFPLTRTLYQIPQNTYIAGNSIIVKENVVIGPNTTLKVGTPNGCESTINQGNPSVICNSTTNTYYKKSHGLAREHSKAANDLDTKEDKESAFAFYPNPATYKVIFSYYLKEASQVSLSLFNSNGQLIATPIHDFQTGGAYEFSFDTSSIQSGLYFIHFVSNGLERREKLVINK